MAEAEAEIMAGYERRLRPAAGVRLSCTEAGPHDGPLTILLHGFPEDALAWRAQIDALAAAGLRVVAPDQRGYGGSDRPADRRAYALDILAADIAALAAGLGPGRFNLAGHDWGGVVAWRVASRHPDRVRRLAILNAPHPEAFAGYALRHPTQLLRSSYMAAFQAPALPEALLTAHDCRRLIRVLNKTARPGAFSEAELARYRQAWRRPGAMTAMLDWYRAIGLARPGPATRVACPTLVLWGVRDAFLDPGLATAGARLCDDARVSPVEQAGHWLHREAPWAVGDALVRFFAEPRA